MDIRLKNQPFDLEFAPNQDVVYTGLLTGEVKAFSFSESGDYTEKWSLRPTKRSCRALASDVDGTRLFTVSKDRTLHTIDPSIGKITDAKTGAHESPINRVALCMPQMVATGDDDGVIKLWDPRKPSEIRAYSHHFDFISDFLWLDDKKTLVATSGDGSLSAIDVRSNKPKPVVHSEDQEDELLSITSIKNNTKLVVGTQLGILSIFNRSAGYGDCVDRIPGHPHSVDALATLTDDVVATGSSDGLIRLVQILPSKLLGVIGDHGEFPVERIKIDAKKKWLGSVSHDELLKLIDVEDPFESEDEEGGEDSHSDKTEDGPGIASGDKVGKDPSNLAEHESDEDSEDEEEGGEVAAETQPSGEVKQPVAPISPNEDAASNTENENDSDGRASSNDQNQKPLKKRRKTKDPNIMSKDMAKQARKKAREKGKTNEKNTGSSASRGQGSSGGFFDGLE